MKRTLLLFIVMVFAATTYGQGSRWYIFRDTLFQEFQASVSKFVGSYRFPMWNDTSAIIGYTGTTGPAYKHVQLISAGLALDPSTDTCEYDWNDTTLFAGSIGVRPTDDYTVDSIFLGGWYSRNNSTPAKRAIVDTLIFALVRSNTTGATADMAMNTIATPYACYGVPPLTHPQLFHDVGNNRVGHNSGTTGTPTTEYYKVLLTANDTNVISPKNSRFPRPGHVPPDPVMSFTVAANQIMAATVTFKSGDAAYPVFPGQDTVYYSTHTATSGYKFNSFELEVNYATNSSAVGSSAECPYHDSLNYVTGYFGFEGGRYPHNFGKYIPNWAIADSVLGVPLPSYAQFPNIGYHIACATCPLLMPPPPVGAINSSIKNITVTPNPANEILNISFTPGSTAATVVLTDMLGQVVARQSVIGGDAELYTANLPAGIYMYTIQSGNEMASGRVAIVH